MIIYLSSPVETSAGVLRAVKLRRLTAEDGERILSMCGGIDQTTAGNWRLLAIAAAVLCDLPVEIVAKMSATDIKRVGDEIAARRGTPKETQHDEAIDLLARQIN